MGTVAAPVSTTTTFPILGSVLDGLQKRIDGSINQMINTSANAGFDIETECGRQVTIAIGNARNAYEDCLNQTMDKVKQAVQDSINSLTSMVQDVEQRNLGALETLESRVTEWITALPLAGWKPQLLNVRPRYVVVKDTTENTMINFEGLFKYAGDPRYQPTFKLNDKVLTPCNNATQKLSFMMTVGNATLDKCAYAIGTLNVPYPGWTGKYSFDFKVWLGALPISPGKITVYYTAHRITQATKHIVSGTVVANASQYCPARWVIVKNSFYPETGWYVIPNSVRGPIVDQGCHGSHDTPKIVSIDANQIVTSVGLSAADGPHMGQVPYHVEFDEVQNVPVTNTRQDDISLQWNDSKVLDTAADEQVSKIVFDAFDGTHSEFAGPNLDNPYLKVSFEGGKFVLRAEVPQDIVNRGYLHI